MKLRALLIAILSPFGLALPIMAAQAPPQFVDHALPVQPDPPPPLAWPPYFDVIVLVLSLILVAVLALKFRSRRAVWVVMLASLLYWGFYRDGCICAIGSVQNVTHSLFSPADNLEFTTNPEDGDQLELHDADKSVTFEFDKDGEIAGDIPVKIGENSYKTLTALVDAIESNLAIGAVANAPPGANPVLELTQESGAAYRYDLDNETGGRLAQRQDYVIPLFVTLFFILPLGMALLAGRVFCAGVCPLGAIQDAVVWKPIQVPRALDQGLGMLRYVYLVLAVGLVIAGAWLALAPPRYLICEYDPFVGMFRFSGTTGLFVLGGALLVMGLFLGRPYCRYLCPYGALLGVFSRFSHYRVTITPDECVQCRLCEEACPFGAIRTPSTDLGVRERTADRGVLATLIVLLPVLAVVGGFAGYYLGSALSSTHLTVVTAEAVRAEIAEFGEVRGNSDETEAFNSSAQPLERLYAGREHVIYVYRIVGMLCGGVLGLLFGLKMINVTLRRRRPDYDIDQAKCVVCGRCYDSCPVGKETPPAEDAAEREPEGKKVADDVPEIMKV